MKYCFSRRFAHVKCMVVLKRTRKTRNSAMMIRGRYGCWIPCCLAPVGRRHSPSNAQSPMREHTSHQRNIVKNNTGRVPGTTFILSGLQRSKDLLTPSATVKKDIAIETDKTKGWSLGSCISNAYIWSKLEGAPSQRAVSTFSSFKSFVTPVLQEL